MALQAVSCCTSARDGYQFSKKEVGTEKIASIGAFPQFCVALAGRFCYKEQVGSQGHPRAHLSAQSVVHGRAALALPSQVMLEMLEMQDHGLHPTPTQSEPAF